MSPRKLLAFQPTMEEQHELFKRLHCRVPSSEHVYNQVIGLLRGNGRLMSDTGRHLNERPYPTNANGLHIKRRKITISHWPKVVYKDRELREEEKPKRHAIVGMKSSYAVSNFSRSIDVARDMYHANCSLHYQGEQKAAVIGPVVLVTKHGSHVLLRPGRTMDPVEVDVSSGILSNRNLKKVMKTDGGDVLHLRRGGKNHSSLFQNVLTCLKGGGMLIPMIVRGTGAALTVAGQYPLPSSNPNAFREAPTHIVSSGQEVDDPTCLAIAECVHHRRCVNVFYKAVILDHTTLLHLDTGQ